MIGPPEIQAQELVERALEVPKAPDCVGRVVIVTETSTAVLRWANSTMTTNGHSSALAWSVISLVELPGGSAAGVVSSSVTVTDRAQLVDAVRESEQVARDSGPARDTAPLPDPSGADPEWSAQAAETSIAVFTELADQLAEAFTAGLAGGQLLYGFASHDVATMWLGTSTGVRRRWVQPTGSVELNAKQGPASAWGGVSTADFTDVDLTLLAADLGVRLGWGKRRLELPADRYPVIIPPTAAADLLLYLAWSMEGRPAQEGRSALSAPGGGTRVGERLTELPLTMFSDPNVPGMQFEPFLATTRSSDDVSVFDNGAPVGRVDWIRNGVINELTYPRAAAAEFGTDFTPPGDNLIVVGGPDVGVGDLVQRTERGLLLTCLWYIRLVDPETLLLTGLTRDGVYLVEGGEVVGEVNNFRFNESPLDLLRRVTEIGATERTVPREWKDWFTRAALPPLVVPDFNMSSVSQAS